MLLRHGSRAALHLPIQEVEEETEISSSRGPPPHLPSRQIRCHLILRLAMSAFLKEEKKQCFAEKLGVVWFAFVFLFTEVDIGLKKDALLSADGSSLEALLKGDSLEKRTTADLRGSEEDSNQSDYTGSLNPASRIRKVSSSKESSWRFAVPVICPTCLIWLLPHRRESSSQMTSWTT